MVVTIRIRVTERDESNAVLEQLENVLDEYSVDYDWEQEDN